MKNILITGGAGYIGSHIAEVLILKKKKIFIVDNLSTGFKKLLNKQSHFTNLNILNTSKLKKIILEKKIDSIIHLAASLSIAEGEKYPKLYYKNNVLGTRNFVNFVKINQDSSLTDIFQDELGNNEIKIAMLRSQELTTELGIATDRVSDEIGKFKIT